MIDAINLSGGISLTINRTSDYKKIINLCDGIIMQGGDDVLDFDLKVIDYVYRKNIPYFGICLGMQEAGIYLNGILDNTCSHYNNYHYIKVDKNSILYSILKQDKVLVNSRHKQFIKTTDAYISSTSDVIESIEDKNKTFFLGVQWHPEDMFSYDYNSRLLFKYFINKCMGE